jgi:secreted PhoX family phosphatase
MWVVDSQGSKKPGQIVEFLASTLATGGNINVAPAMTLSGSSTTLGNPSGCAFDSDGALWIVNDDPTLNADTNLVISFTAAQLAAGGNVAPTVVINNGQNVCNGVDLAFDPNGNLWVANLCAAIAAYKKSDLVAPGGSLTPMAKVNQSTGVNGLAFDSAGNLWTSLQGSVQSITEFKASELPTANNNINPITTINGALTKIDNPTGLAFVGGDLWAAQQGTTANALTKFAQADLAGAAAADAGNIAPTVVSGANTKLSSPWKIVIH